MKLRSRSLVFLVAVFAVALLGCIREGSPQLIQVLEIAPGEAEVGDRIEILGAGFPQGKPAHLAFRGTLFRPGERPIEDAEILAEGTVRNAQQIELAFTDALQALFCGTAGDATHTTFDGELEVAFAAASPSSPQIAATLYKVSLDVRPPPPRAAVARARDAEGDRALQFIGIVASPVAPASGGIAVEKVEPSSRADRAGVVAGDVLAKVDGVRVAAKSDLVPAPGAQLVTIALRRGTDAREQLRQVSFDGFRSTAPAELLGAAIVLALAAAIVLLFFAPTARATAWIERRFAARLRAAAIDRAWAQDRATWIIGTSVTALIVVAPFGQYRVAASLDVGIVFLVIASALLTTAVVTGGGATHLSLGAMVRAAWRTLSAHVPAALGVVGVVVVAGSLRVQDIVRAQGGMPWDWYAFRNPITLALFLAFVAGIGAEGEDASSSLAEASIAAAPHAEPPSARARLFAVAKHVGLFASCAVAAAVFLGGWQVPGVDVAQGGGQNGAPLVGAVMLAAKTWALVGAIVLARRALPALRGEETAALAWKYFVPIALVAIALAIGWRFWSPPRAVDRMASRVLFVATLLTVAHVAYRVRFGLRSPHAHAHVNPFL